MNLKSFSVVSTLRPVQCLTHNKKALIKKTIVQKTTTDSQILQTPLYGPSRFSAQKHN